MTERCIVRVKFTPAGAPAGVRSAVGGFLRYVQHRDLHPEQSVAQAKPQVAGMLKYVAHRDQASARAELFGPDGLVGSTGRKAFAEFVARSIERSQPQLFRTRDGHQMDRRRAVSRFVISPERVHGLDLERLTRAAIAGLEADAGVDGVRWIAAIHRNTRHHHVHLVVAGMHPSGDGYQRFDITRRRLAAMKSAVALEIDRQRERSRVMRKELTCGSQVASGDETNLVRALGSQLQLPTSIPTLPSAGARPAKPPNRRQWHRRSPISVDPIVQLRAVARNYQRRMQREAEDEAWRMRWERAA